MRQGDWRYVDAGRESWGDRFERWLPWLDTGMRVFALTLLLTLALLSSYVIARLDLMQVTVNGIAFEGIACPRGLQ